EVATFEDHVFGSIKVAIAEKINESDRGTARNGGVRARIDSLVKQARTSRGQPELSCPFAVFISQPLSIPVPPEAELAVRGCLEDGDLGGAELMLQESVRQCVARLSQDDGIAGGGDIYNGGGALFRGFEKTGGLGVYEMVPPSSALFSLLAQHHLPGWLVEHAQGKGEEEPPAEATGT